MGNHSSTLHRLNFEDIQEVIKQKEHYILINMSCGQEEHIINHYISNNKDKNIVIYGTNVNDMTIYDKYEQLIKLGFRNVYIYQGGMFEWLCLQDIYSSELFPTTKKELDILKYKPRSKLNTYYLTNESLD
jgi:rhodanese-related sulfurtransferase